MLLHGQRSGITHVGNPILAFLAVADEKLACFYVNAIQPQRTNFADPQSAVPQQIETGLII
jgi:hypothetical protein